MLFRINDCLINLDDIRYFMIDKLELNKSTTSLYTINAITNPKDKFSFDFLLQTCTEEELLDIINKLKDKAPSLYKLTPNFIINVSNISAIQRITRGLQITFIGERMSNHNLIIDKNDIEDIDKSLEDISRLS